MLCCVALSFYVSECLEYSCTYICHAWWGQTSQQSQDGCFELVSSLQQGIHTTGTLHGFNIHSKSCHVYTLYTLIHSLLSCSEYRYSSCLAPPPLSDDDIDSVLDPTGPLDNYDHYIAEYLLRRSGDILPSVFFRRVQAGFVFGYDEHTDMRPQCYSGIPSQNVTSHMNNFTATVWYNNQVRHIHFYMHFV